MIVPPGICALICIWFALSDQTARTAVKFDWLGFIALSVAVTAAQLIFDRGHRLDWFESNEIILFAFIGALALWVFIVHCLTVPEPFLNPRLLLDRNFSIGVLLAFIMGMLNFTSIVLYPTLLHDLRGYPDNAIAALIAARGIGNWAAFLVVVQFTRMAPRLAIAVGMAIQAAAGFWMAQFNINLTETDVFWSNFLLGFGQSIAFTPMTVMAFSTLPVGQVTEGSSIFTLMRNFGSSLFISVAVLVVSRSTASNYSRLTEFITPYNKTLTMPGLPTQWSLDETRSLLNLSNELLRQAAMIGYLNAFYLMAFAALAAMPLALFMQRVKREP
jgi:DHA2 family multidrug resistance protein